MKKMRQQDRGQEKMTMMANLDDDDDDESRQVDIVLQLLLTSNAFTALYCTERTAQSA